MVWPTGQTRKPIFVHKSTGYRPENKRFHVFCIFFGCPDRARFTPHATMPDIQPHSPISPPDSITRRTAVWTTVCMDGFDQNRHILGRRILGNPVTEIEDMASIPCTIAIQHLARLSRHDLPGSNIYFFKIGVIY